MGQQKLGARTGGAEPTIPTQAYAFACAHPRTLHHTTVNSTMPSSILSGRSLRHALLLLIVLVFAAAHSAHARGVLRGHGSGHVVTPSEGRPFHGFVADDGWTPGAGLRLTGCILRNCPMETKACVHDTVCRNALRCTLGEETVLFVTVLLGYLSRHSTLPAMITDTSDAKTRTP